MLGHLIDYRTIMRTDNLGGKFYFRANFTTYFTLSSSIFVTIWPKKDLPIDLDKFHQHNPAFTAPNNEARESISAKYHENIQSIKISKFYLKKN